MAFKLVVFSALVATVANAGVLPLATYQAAHVAPLAVHAKLVDPDHDPHPQYSYSYDVHDAHTGDIKSQHEMRDGDVVQGSYSLVDPDGTRRTVDYTADPHNGFNAVVHKEPAHVAVKAVAPVALHRAPAITYHAHPETVYAHQVAPTAYIAHRDIAYANPAIYAYHH